MSFGARFLSFPDLFPARRAGEPWGDRQVSLDLPGGPYHVAGLSAVQAAAAGERFGELCREAGPGAGGPETAAVRGLLFTAPPSDFRAVDTRGWEYAMDFEHEERSVCLAGLQLMARLDWSPGLGGALWTSEDGPLFPGIFENFLRVLVAYRLLELGGVVLHSAGVTAEPSRNPDMAQPSRNPNMAEPSRNPNMAEPPGSTDDGAFLFLGPSGAGKTTLSRKSEERGHTVLSDDLNALLPGLGFGDMGGVPRVVKLPFTGDLGDRREAHPPRPRRRLRPLSQGETLALLFACSPFVNADPHRREILLDVLSVLARAAPGRALTFSLTGDFWGILRGTPP
jgi:hypothetical protein